MNEIMNDYQFDTLLLIVFYIWWYLFIKHEAKRLIKRKITKSNDDKKEDNMNDLTDMSKCICEINVPKKKNGLNYMCLSAYSHEIPRIYLGVTKNEGQFLFAAYGNGPDDISSTHYILNYCPECGRKLR